MQKTMAQIRTVLALSVSLGAGMGLTAANAQSATDFYKGKTVNLIISSSAGGGYDTLSRTIARHLPKHIPGQPTVSPRNMPGAGGIIATKHLYTVAPKDGLTIGGVQNNTPFEPLLGTKEADYDPRRFNWLGSPSFETALLIVWHTVPVNSIEDLRKREITIASSGANSTPSFFTRLLNDLLGTKMRIVVGYPGQNESFAAMERGEVDGYSSIFWSSVTATKPDWIRDKKIKSIVQYGPEKEAAVGPVPSVNDYLTREEDKVLLEAAIAPLALGRPFLMPPDVPADRVKLMQDAFAATFKDKEFLADADRLKLGVNVPRSAAEVKAIVEKAYATPKPVVDRLQKIAQP
jgi:tripartite-type tricarboxylate transporter receptor subunit TctC